MPEHLSDKEQWAFFRCQEVLLSPKDNLSRVVANYPEFRITPVNSGYYTLQIYPRVYVNMFRFKPRATLGLILFTVLIQNSDKQWKVLSGYLEKVALENSLGSSDFPSGLRPSGKSDDPREFPRATFSRQPLRTFHCLYQSSSPQSITEPKF